MNIAIDEDLRLEQTAQKHAKALWEAVDANREHLAEFLPWVGSMQSVDDFKNYISTCEQLYREKKEVSFVILYRKKIVGRIGIHHINVANKTGAIGYWLAKDAEGNGIITRSCKWLIEYGFNELNLHRIELKAAVDNHKSQAIPQKLNFTKEGIMRQAEWVNGKPVDLVLFSLIRG